MARKKKIPESGRLLTSLVRGRIEKEAINRKQVDEIRDMVGKDKKGEPYISDDFHLLEGLNLIHVQFNQIMQGTDLTPPNQRIYLDLFQGRLSDFLEVFEKLGEKSWVRIQKEVLNYRAPEDLLDELKSLLEAARRARESMGTGRSAMRQKRREDLDILVEDLSNLWFKATGRKAGFSTGSENKLGGPFLRFIKASIPFYPLKNYAGITDNSIAEAIKKLVYLA